MCVRTVRLCHRIQTDLSINSNIEDITRKVNKWSKWGKIKYLLHRSEMKQDLDMFSRKIDQCLNVRTLIRMLFFRHSRPPFPSRLSKSVFCTGRSLRKEFGPSIEYFISGHLHLQLGTPRILRQLNTTTQTWKASRLMSRLRVLSRLSMPVRFQTPLVICHSSVPTFSIGVLCVVSMALYLVSVNTRWQSVVMRTRGKAP